MEYALPLFCSPSKAMQIHRRALPPLSDVATAWHLKFVKIYYIYFTERLNACISPDQQSKQAATNHLGYTGVWWRCKDRTVRGPGDFCPFCTAQLTSLTLSPSLKTRAGDNEQRKSYEAPGRCVYLGCIHPGDQIVLVISDLD